MRAIDTLTGRLTGVYMCLLGKGEGHQLDIDTGRDKGKPNRGALPGELEFKPTSTSAHC